MTLLRVTFINGVVHTRGLPAEGSLARRSTSLSSLPLTIREICLRIRHASPPLDPHNPFLHQRPLSTIPRLGQPQQSTQLQPSSTTVHTRQFPSADIRFGGVGGTVAEDAVRCGLLCR